MVSDMRHFAGTPLPYLLLLFTSMTACRPPVAANQRTAVQSVANQNPTPGPNGMELATTGQPLTLADLWTGTARFEIDPTPIGFTGMHFLALARDSLNVKPEDLNYSYYITNETIAGKFVIGTGLAYSTDGIQFENRGSVLLPSAKGAWDDNMTSFASVFRTASGWFMVYEGQGLSPGDVGLATSADGSHWTKHPQPILLHSQGKPWEKTNIGTPTIYFENGTWYVFYHGWDGRDLHVGVATGASLTNLTRANGGDPILMTSASGFDDGTVGRRDIVKEGDTYYMVYEGSRDLSTSSNGAFDTVAWSSGVARSKSLLGPWEKLPSGPILPMTNKTFGHDGPEWVRTADGKIHVYFRDYVNGTNYTRRATLVARQPTPCTAFSAQTDLKHQIGRQDQEGWSANAAQDAAGYLTYGPYAQNIGGPSSPAILRASFHLQVDSIGLNSDLVATLDVFDATAAKQIQSRTVRRSDFKAARQYQDFDIDFAAPAADHAVEMRTFWHDRSYLKIDRIRVGEPSSMATCDAAPATSPNPPPAPVPPTAPKPNPQPGKPALVFQVASDLRHNIGRLDGTSWSANTKSDSPGYLFFGPYTTAVSSGPHTAKFRLMIDSTVGVNQAVMTIDVYDATAGTVLASRIVKRKDFAAAKILQDLSLNFVAPAGDHTLEFRGHWHDTAAILAESVRVDP